MKVTLALLGALALVQALPSTLVTRDDLKCGDSMYVDHWRSDGPSVSDCQALVADLEARNDVDINGIWLGPLQKTPRIFTSGARGLFKQGSCTFAVASADEYQQAQLFMSKDDVLKLIRSTISGYQKDGKVEVRGALFCGKTPEDRTGIWWSVLTDAELSKLNQGDRS